MNVCTIIAKNYVAYARVLARSLEEHDPEARIWTLIIDDFEGYINPAEEPFEVLTPADVGCDPFNQMAITYSVLELSTAVKPWLLRHLMAETGGPVTYLDPDIKIYGPLRHLDALAASHGVVLIPHTAEPIPPDGHKPSQVDIMIAGVYNLGYISVAPGPEIARLLDWWADRLVRDCRVDPAWGYFVDQRWFDLAPGFLSDYAIVRDPEYNVAYWNLHSRQVELNGGGYLVDGRPLAFFHFSGFDADHPKVLSRYQDRVDVVGRPALERLLGDYADQVHEAGHARTRKWGYSYDALGDGSRLDSTVRAAYGALYEDFARDRGDAAMLSPFSPGGTAAFKRWLTGQAPGAPSGVSRLLARVYEDRADLRGAFPDLADAGPAGLLSWAREYGSHEIPLLAESASAGHSASDMTTGGSAPPSSGPVDATSAPLRNAPWGVNVVGYFRSEAGTGEAARQVVSALDAGGVPTLPIHGQTVPVSRQGHSYVTASPANAWFALNLICMNADMLPEFAGQAGPGFFAGRYSIGLWFWEVSRFPERWRDSFLLLDEVWAPTAHVAAALEPLATVPVTTVRIPIQPPPLEPRTRTEFGLREDRCTYLFSFDYLSVFKRKNPLAVIDAFTQAFSPGEGAALVIKCINHEHDPKSHERLRAAAARHSDIEVIDRYMSPAENSGLTALCDCYVSLHRAEGFGLVPAEAMWRGKPVIATAYSGNLDFMAESNSLLVDYTLVPIGPDAPPYPADGEWAEPDVSHAARLMRQVFDDQAAAKRLGEIGARDIRRTHSAETAGEIMRRRLESIWAIGRARSPADAARQRPRSLSMLSLQLRRGPTGAPAQRGRAAREAVRHAALRAMRPFTAYQETVNQQVLAALDDVSAETRELSRAAMVERVELVSELRGGPPGTVHSEMASLDEIKQMLKLQTDRSLYLALSELRERHAQVTLQPARVPEHQAITPFELRVFSQNGEDGALAEILRRTGAQTRFFVEFGVESGTEGNCVYLADVAGWRGLFMEADDDMYGGLERKYAGQPLVQTARAIVTPENIEELLMEASVPLEPDVLSIDVDGQDYWIWEAIESYRPRVVIVEYNSALDPRRRLVQPRDRDRPWDGTDYFGASLGALRSLADTKGYRLVHTELSGVNAFFVRTDLGEGAFPESTDVALRGVPNYFQTGYHHPAASADSGPYVDLDAEQ